MICFVCISPKQDSADSKQTYSYYALSYVRTAIQNLKH